MTVERGALAPERHRFTAHEVVLDTELLQAADRAARRTKRNRSALIRDALREHLGRLAVREMEERDREGYSRHFAPPDKKRPVVVLTRDSAIAYLSGGRRRFRLRRPVVSRRLSV